MAAHPVSSALLLLWLPHTNLSTAPAVLQRIVRLRIRWSCSVLLQERQGCHIMPIRCSVRPNLVKTCGGVLNLLASKFMQRCQ